MLLAAAGTGRASRERPPAAHTGGFGEPTCDACHFGDAVNSGPGTLRLGGPGRWTPGETYIITIDLMHPDLRAAGFQLTARFAANGEQAGRLTPLEPTARRTDITVDARVEYAHHLLAGTEPTAPGSASWRVRWTAPDAAPPGTSVLFHAAANAADGDDSPLGDFIYTAAAASSPAPAKPPQR
jgi:hypothetical protein